ncbi:hypothetical protein CF319_g5889 [Tilletia indica]|nr:hypothetical protein CF319_g5889 [Tilletia indica]
MNASELQRQVGERPYASQTELTLVTPPSRDKMSWFSSQFNRWSGVNREGSDGNAPSSSAAEIRRVEIIWGKQHLQVVLPRAVQPPTLRNLKDEIASLTSVPVQQQKLIHQGLLLKDERVSLGAFGIREGSKLTLIGTAGGVNANDDSRTSPAGDANSIPSGRLAAEEAERARRAREADDSEEGLMRRIEQTLKGVEEDLVPEIEQLEREVAAHKSGPTSAPSAAHTSGPTPSATASAAIPRPGATAAAAAQSDRPSTQDDAHKALDVKQLTALHRKLSEFLLRALLALDTIPINSDTQRAARKGAVRKVQAYLDRVDHAWDSYKANPVTAAQL